VAGVSEITSEDIERDAASRRAVPVSGSVTTEGGHERDPFYERARVELEDEEILGVTAQQVAAHKQAKTEIDIAADLANTRAQQAAAELKINQEIAARVQRETEVAEKVRQTFESSSVDPNRMFKGEGGTATSIVAAIAAGLGAFGATLGRTENFALNSINGMIARDVAAQEADIRIRGAASDNALAQLNRSTGSLEQSKLLLTQMQTNWALARADQTRAAARIDAIDPKFNQIKTGLELAALDGAEKRRLEALGRNTATVNQQFAATRKAQAGYSYEADIGTPQQQVDFTKDVKDLEQAEANVQKTHADTAKTVSSIGQGKGGGAAGGKGGGKGAALSEAGIEAIENIAAEMGAKWNPDKQEYEGDVDGVYATGAVLGSEKSQKIAAAVDAAVAPIDMAEQGGGAPNKDTMEAIRGGIMSTSGAKMKANLTAHRRQLEATRRALANQGGGDEKDKESR